MIDELLESNPEFRRMCAACKGPVSDGCGCEESALVMRYALTWQTPAGLALFDHFATHGEAMKAAENEEDKCIVVKAQIEFAGNGNIRKWAVCA